MYFRRPATAWQRELTCSAGKSWPVTVTSHEAKFRSRSSKPPKKKTANPSAPLGLTILFERPFPRSQRSVISAFRNVRGSQRSVIAVFRNVLYVPVANEVSSRPERSVVEGPAVDHPQ